MRATDEFEEELAIQLRLLKKACHAFDEGDLDESRNISRALRVLCADDVGMKNDCLIRITGRDQNLFVDSSFRYHPKNVAPEFHLIVAALGPASAGPRAFLDEIGESRFIAFNDWLEQPVLDDKEGNSFSRLRLIKALANFDGGTHYPRELRTFVRKLKDIAFSGYIGHSAKEIPMKGAAEQTLRQIAHEVIRSLDPDYRRAICVENGALITGCMEAILYPGRKVHFRGGSKTVQNARSPSYIGLPINGIGGPAARLPYEGTGRNDRCPCGSGLKFKKCCETAREFDADFIRAFEQTYQLDG